MNTLATGISYSDLDFQGLRHIIATAMLHGVDGITIVDPGPASTLPTLQRELAVLGATVQDVTALFLTHIHLDHAGGSGALLRLNPRIKVHVHEAGAGHLVDPTKLLASATRLYGDHMDRLWGEVVPVPDSAIAALQGGERIAGAGRIWDVAYTPGHASHHVSYFSADTGIAFVGDTAGVQVVRSGFIVPPTPPPDIDIPLWFDSLETIARWRPQSLFLTHFGVTDTPAAHLAELRDRLGFTLRLAREAMTMSSDDAVRERWFVDRIRKEIERHASDADRRAYEVAGRFDLNWRGLARYITKREQPKTASVPDASR
jgi:glyoxylase-like metal-dependent hydrolase (beta-lactamase superfamily II)